MDIKRSSFFFLMILILIMGLAACERSLAPRTTESPQATNSGGAPTNGTGDVMGQLEQFVTQTAMAGGLGAGTAQSTPGPDTTQPDANAGAATTPPADAAPMTEAPAVVTTEVPPPPTATLIIVPTATPGLPGRYTLEKNEFPYCIARRFDIDPAALLNANGLGANTTVSSGQELRIPKDAPSFPGKRALRSHPDVYSVQAGDTIYSIACAYGDVDPNAIVFANGLKAPYNLNSGQELQIP